jgi:hypothetical protein
MRLWLTIGQGKGTRNERNTYWYKRNAYLWIKVECYRHRMETKKERWRYQANENQNLTD